MFVVQKIVTVKLFESAFEIVLSDSIFLVLYLYTTHSYLQYLLSVPNFSASDCTRQQRYLQNSFGYFYVFVVCLTPL